MCFQHVVRGYPWGYHDRHGACGVARVASPLNKRLGNQAYLFLSFFLSGRNRTGRLNDRGGQRDQERERAREEEKEKGREKSPN
jgi:hypothetical protein